MNYPLISICIPAYKRPECLTRLLESIEIQTYKNFEIIVTDDTPGEEIEMVLQKFTHLPLRYFKNIPALGSPGNWNSAISKSTAEWVQLMHADDWYANPESLQQFAKAICTTKSSFIFSVSKEINTVNGKKKNLFLNAEKRRLLDDNPVNLVFDNVIGHPSTVLFKKDEAIAYNTTYIWVVDIDFYIRYLKKHPGYTHITQPLINIGIDEQQISSTAYKNPFVEIPEYLLLINTFSEDIQNTNYFVFHCLWNLVRKFRIKNWSYIQTHGYSGSEMKVVHFIINYQKRIPGLVLKQTNWSAVFVKKCFNNWLKNTANK